jgi:hypothetical protein
MMGTAVSLDRVAQALGVSTDEGIVERLTPVARRLDAVVTLLAQQRAELAGAVPNADEVIAVAMGHLQDAVVYVAQVSRAAEDHRRGEW